MGAVLTLKQCPNGGDVFQWAGVGWRKGDSETLSLRILKDEQGFGENGCGEDHSMGKQEKALQSIWLSDFMKAGTTVKIHDVDYKKIVKKWNSQVFLTALQEAKDIGFL